MIWNKKAECMSVEEKEEFSLEDCRRCKTAYENVNYYKNDLMR